MNIKKSFKKKVAVISMLGALGVSAGPKVEADLIDKLSIIGGILSLIQTAWIVGTGQDLCKWFMGKIGKPKGLWPKYKLDEAPIQHDEYDPRGRERIPNGVR